METSGFMVKLGVNIDHVATLRQARKAVEPDPVWAAVEAQLGGADIITVHLREDRRHIQDRDVFLLSETVRVPLNLEMAAVDEIVKIALKLQPAMVTLVPEKRTEVTTEGGLDVAAQIKVMARVTDRLKRRGIQVSAFVDADTKQVVAAAKAGFGMCELHTGPYAIAENPHQRSAELEKLRSAGEAVLNEGMQFNAGHGLNLTNVAAVAGLPHLSELHIGHSIVSYGMFVGLANAVREMKRAINAESR